MPTAQEFEEARARAKRVIQSTWQDIAKSFTVGWGGPIEAIESKFPFVTKTILSIRPHISEDLPIMILQSREDPPKQMILAVPYWKDTGNPFNCRLVAMRGLSQPEMALHSNFAQAFWYSIKSGLLPPLESGVLEKALETWTGGRLFSL